MVNKIEQKKPSAFKTLPVGNEATLRTEQNCVAHATSQNRTTPGGIQGSGMAELKPQTRAGEKQQ